MDAHVTGKTPSDSPEVMMVARDPIACSTHVRDGGQLLLTLSERHLTVLFSVLLGFFWCVIFMARGRRVCTIKNDIEAQDDTERQNQELVQCQDWVSYIGIYFGLLVYCAFLMQTYCQQNRTEAEYVWSYLGRWHITAFLKTLWLVVTLVTQKSDLYRVLQTLSARFFKSTERPFNIIAVYMLMTSYMLLPVVIDILSYYTFPESYPYGMCFEQLKMSPLWIVMIVFYLIVVGCTVVMLCASYFKGTNTSIVAIGNRQQLKDDEPTLLSDDENDTIESTNETKNDKDSNNGNHNQSNGENQNVILSDKIKTIDEGVGYEKEKNEIEREMRIRERQNKREMQRMLFMAVIQPLLLWLWVVFVFHSNGGFSFSTNVDYGSMMMLWGVVEACYAIVTACFSRSQRRDE